MMNHKNFPEMPASFDRRVRNTLEALPDQPQRARRFPFRRVACIGLAAALCVGGTAFAASDLPQQIGRHFQLLLHGSDEALLSDYTITPAPGALSDENDDYRVTVESVLFDESAGAGVVSLHIEDKKKTGVRPFGISETLEQYKGDNIVWSNLAECMGNEDGQLVFDIWYGDKLDWCAGRFYLDTARSTENDYYVEGAFIPVGDYTAADGPLRLEVGEQGAYLEEGGLTRLKPVLSVPLPEPRQMPYYRTSDGRVTLSQIGLRVNGPDMGCVVDDLDYIAVKMKDGSVLEIVDEENKIERTLYALGQESGVSGEGYDVGTYVLAKTFDLQNVRSVILNGDEYPLSE
ncbi:MAG: hypothetical protein Q4C72_06585 [Eubacteriales bacterium]|nr:hypothetical protein [Eubacteriales bacterium]